MKQILKRLVLSAAVGLMAPVAQAADWEGAYIGGYGAVVNGSSFFAGAQAGYNFSLGGGAYGGVEVDGMTNTAFSSWVGTVQGRLGYELAPDLLLYGQLGAGPSSGGSNWWLAGAGAQYAFVDNLSLRIGVDRYQIIGGGTVNWAVKAGLVYGF